MKLVISLVLTVAFIIVFAQFAIKSLTLLKEPAWDFEVFYLAGRQVLEHQDPYQRVQEISQSQTPFKNPPPFLLLFTPLATLPILQSQALWFIGSLLFFLTASYFLFKITETINPKFPNLPRWQLWLVYLVLALRFFPLRYDFGSGQVDALLFLLLVLVFYFQMRKKELLGSAMLVLAIITKVTPLAFLLVLFLQREIKMLIFVVLGVLAMSSATLVILGQDIFGQYLVATQTYFHFGISAYYNQSLVGFLNRVFSDQVVVQGIYIFVLVAYLLFFGYHFRNFSKDNKLAAVVLWNIVTLTILIFSPYSWQYHFVLAIFPLVTSVCLALRLKMPSWNFLVIACSYLLMAWNFRNTSLYDSLGIPGALLVSHTFFGALFLLILNFYFLKSEDVIFRFRSNRELLREHRQQIPSRLQRRKLAA